MYKLSLTLFLLPVLCNAQYYQTLRGTIVDKDSKAALVGVSVCITDVHPSLKTVTDSNGNYVIYKLPTGTHTILINQQGYQQLTLVNVLVTSAKEVIVPIEMEGNVIKLDEITIAYKQEHVNNMAIVSSRTFDVQETERYAGSRADPARMASNFAGVQGGDDSRNDLIIRGNSPQGVLWRLEGVDIPNPNHFAIAGTSGGPVSMLNNKTLANSDFFTGAFPSEYGNAVGGVFDLRLRNGNNDRYEFTGQLGFLGTEIVAEGPVSKKKGSSFLLSYRYSTLKIFSGLNIPIGTSSIPNYQDATFKLNFPIGKKSDIAVFGIGGLSKINLIVSTLTDPTPQLYGQSDRDQYFSSNTGIIGTSFSHAFNKTSFMKIVIAETGSEITGVNDKVFRDATFKVDSLKRILGYDFSVAATVMHWHLSKKLSPRHTISGGIINNYYHLSLQDSSREYPTSRQDWQLRENFKGGTNLAQAYLQYKFKPSETLILTAGIHGQYLALNGATSMEPRVAVRWALSSSAILTAGYGLHSQMLPMYQYYAYQPGTRNRTNEDISFIRSHHFVIGYYRSIAHDLHLHIETYYQYLFNVPIEIRTGSSYSALDEGATYSRYFPGTLADRGTGYNYGAELTAEKKFSRGFYILFTGSLFDSKAKGNDGIYRNTDFNSHYATNLLGGYERKLGRKCTLITGLKCTYLGRKHYTPPDVAASNAYGDIVVIDSLRNSQHFKPYFRLDLKLGLRFNAKKLTHELGLDIINLTNTRNVLTLTYSSDLAAKGSADPFYYQYQLGLLPIFYYRIDLGISRHKEI
ncbi:MAG: hypothetical protein BGO69_08870 [Bacteroidetes bacterium 46-16]|nr:MAG: hypothetical protein BGO69_08870 [Bacteroidetes bacterium 46-16]